MNSWSKLAAALVVLLVGGSFLSTNKAVAANGDILTSAAHCFGGAFDGAVDVAYDTINDQLYAIDQSQGMVCTYTLGALPHNITAAATIPQPIGSVGFPPMPGLVAVGITFNPAGNTGLGSFWVLTAGGQITEMDNAGLELTAPITLTIAAGASISGLAYDTSNDSLWYRDNANGVFVNVDLLGVELGTLAIPGSAPFFGKGLSYVEDGADRFLTYTHGTVIDYKAVSALRVDLATGLSRAYLVDLEAVHTAEPGASLMGIVIPPAGDAFYVSTLTTLYKIDGVQPTLPAPSNLVCLSETNGSISLTWENNGTQAGDAYVEVIVRRRIGANPPTVLANLVGNVTTYTDTSISDPDNGLLDLDFIYEVVGSDVSGQSIAECEVRTGAGALLRLSPFAGISPQDITYNPVDGLLYVTDSGSYNNDGRIYRYTTDLDLVDFITIDAPFVKGIAYDSDIDRLIVTAGQNPISLGNLRVIDMNTLDGMGRAVEESSHPVQPTPPEGFEITAIAYDPFSKDYLINNIASGRMARVQAEHDGMMLIRGTVHFECPVLNLEYSRGMAWTPDDTDGTYLATQKIPAPGETTQEVQIFEDDCASQEAGAGISLAAMGNLIEEDVVNGIEIVTNSIYVCAGGDARSVFRLMLAPAVDFIRGDTDYSGAVDINDVINITRLLFDVTLPTPECLDAYDLTDNGDIDLSDALYGIFHLFLSGPPPAEPFPALGPDPTFIDGLGC